MSLPYSDKKDVNVPGTPQRSLHERYEVKSTLGAGGFGTVKLATDRHTANDVAVKITPKASLGEGQNQVDYHREVEVLRFLKHPNIAKFYDAFHDDTNEYLVMELCGGGSLASLMAKSPNGMDEKKALQIFRQVIEAIAYLHSKAVSHRDIKPENIVFKDGNAKLVDFGLVHWRSPGGQQFVETYVGTPQYAAYEIHMCWPYVPEKADMFSCGKILSKMLSGGSVEVEGVLRETKAIIVRLMNKRLPKRRPGPAETFELIDEALEKLS